MVKLMSEVFQVGGAACRVADLAEDLIELLESLGPEILSRCTEMEEFCEFRQAVEEYVHLRETTDVAL